MIYSRAVNRWLVTLVWLLTLALPLQGLAASVRMACHAIGTAPTLAQMAALETSTRGPAATRPTPDTAVPCHEADARSADRGAGQAPEARASAGKHASHAGCIACAACHGAAALPATPALPTAEAPSVAPDARIRTAALPYITDGPERPPRSLDA